MPKVDVKTPDERKLAPPAVATRSYRRVYSADRRPSRRRSSFHPPVLRRSTHAEALASPGSRVAGPAVRPRCRRRARPRCRAQEPALTAIRAGRLVDVERGEVRRDQVVLIRGDRIDAIQPASAKIPAGARVIDLSRWTVAAGPDRLPQPPDRRGHGGRRAPAARANRDAGGDERRPERPRDTAGGLHHRPRRGHLSRLRGRGAAGRDRRRHGDRPADAGGRRLRHGLDRRRRAGRRGAGRDAARWPTGSASPTRPTRSASGCGRCSTAGRISSRSSRPAPCSPGHQARRLGVHRGPDPGGGRAGGGVRHVRRRARARRRGNQAGGAGGGAVDRARVADRRRGHRADEAARHLAGRRHLERRLHRQRGAGAAAGRRSISGRTPRPPTRSGRASERRWRRACGSPTAPTAASILTASTRCSCPTWSSMA